MATADEHALLLAERLLALPEPTMRARWLRQQMSALSAEDALTVVRTARDCSVGRCAPFPELWLALYLMLAEEAGAPLREGLERAATERGMDDLASLLRLDEDPQQDARTARIPNFGTDRPLTLGERKSLGRTRDKELLARVLRDPHPDVVHIVLRNPMLTEALLLRVASARPVAGAVLREVGCSERWIVRAPVRAALVLNPHTPRDVALWMVPLLSRGEARRALDVAGLAPHVRQACQAVVAGGRRH